MKKDDAVAILRGVANHLISGEEISYSDKVMLAIDMAIEALSTKDVPDTNVGDMISKQAAIKAIENCTGIYVNNLPTMINKTDAYKVLTDLPSAQPEIVRCKDCKHWQSEERIGNNNVHTLNIASLPCKNWLTGGDWYCGSAERRTDG